MSRDASKPKVLHVVETFLNRSETFIYNYVSAHRDWRPAVLSVFRRHDDEFTAPEIVTLPYPITKRDPAWWYATGLEWLTGRSPWHRRAEAIVKKLAPAAVHAHFGQLGYLMLPVARRLGMPLVTTFYGYDMSVLPQQVKWRKRYQTLFRDGALFLVEGACMRERLLAIGAPADRVRIQRIAIFVDRYPRWTPSHEATALFVGRFREKKGLRYALEAVLAVKKSLPDLRFRIIGDGEERCEMEAFVSENGMGDYVHFLGMCSHVEVLEELSEASVFIHPSVTAANGDSEGGAPTILLEAQAVGVPIVSTLHADIPNVMGRDEDGIYLSPERDVEHLARHLRAALDERRGPRGTFVRARHDVRKEIIELEKKFDALSFPASARHRAGSRPLDQNLK